MLDTENPDRPLGGQPRDNAVRKSQTVTPFLVRFDLDKLGLPRGAEVVSAELSLYVWDPSSQGRTRLAALPLTTAWDESAATWNRPAAGRRWAGGGTFHVGDDTGRAVGQAIVEPDGDPTPPSRPWNVASMSRPPSAAGATAGRITAWRGPVPRPFRR